MARVCSQDLQERKQYLDRIQEFLLEDYRADEEALSSTKRRLFCGVMNARARYSKAAIGDRLDRILDMGTCVEEASDRVAGVMVEMQYVAKLNDELDRELEAWGTVQGIKSGVIVGAGRAYKKSDGEVWPQ